MVKNRKIFILVVCFSLTVFAGQSQRLMPIRPPRRLPGMTAEEHKKETEKWAFQRRQQRLKEGEKRMNLMAREAWKRLLRINERQWKIIEPKYEAELAPDREARIRALGWGGLQSFHWVRYSKGTGGNRAKTPDEMTEGEKIVDELVGLLEDEKSKDEEIRRKIDALQQVRDKARKELPEARRELAAVLTNPRQEAIFLIMGCID